ncbi:MAG: ABC transporter substrate-binding protein [Chloroflexi bacterium]|nr:ABC transporter substrate-binding protein [Chloroflexota bacterium]
MRIRFALASSILVLGSLLANCAPAAAPSPAAKAVHPSPAAATVAPPPGAAAPTPSPRKVSNEPRYGGMLNISHAADPVSYDPVQETSVASMSLIIPNYSGIVQHDPLQPTKVVGDLAQSWEMSPDGLTYTFRLHKNVNWHDGAPFTSGDARFSLEVVRKPPQGVVSPRREWLGAVDKIEAPDKDTLRMTLQYPSGSFLHNLGDGRMVIVPKHVFEAKGNMKKDMVGTGPYKFKSFTPGASFSVVKNADYFIKGRPYLDGITWYIIRDAATRFAALRTHRVQATPWASTGLTPSQAEILKRDLSDKVQVTPYASLVSLALWMPMKKSPWSDIRVRRAVNMAIDRPKELKVSMEGSGEVGGYMPPGSWSLPEAELMKLPGYRQPKDPDIAEAKKLLAEAGYERGFKMSILARNVDYQERGATSVKDQLAQIGIEASIRLHDQGTTNDLLYKREFDVAVYGGAFAFDDPDQVFGQQYVTGVPRNFSDLSDEQIDKWYVEQARALDPAKRKEIVLSMERRLHELVPSSILHWQAYIFGNWKEVRDLKPGIGVYNNLKLQNVWIAEGN